MRDGKSDGPKGVEPVAEATSSVSRDKHDKDARIMDAREVLDMVGIIQTEREKREAQVKQYKEILSIATSFGQVRDAMKAALEQNLFPEDVEFAEKARLVDVVAHAPFEQVTQKMMALIKYHDVYEVLERIFNMTQQVRLNAKLMAAGSGGVGKRVAIETGGNAPRPPVDGTMVGEVKFVEPSIWRKFLRIFRE